MSKESLKKEVVQRGQREELFRQYVDGLAKQMGFEKGDLEDETRDHIAKQAAKVDTRERKGPGSLWSDTDNDRRFPNVNQTQNCWTAVNEYQLCAKVKGDKKHPTCLKRRNDFMNMCPLEWVEAYEEQIEEGRFMGVGDFLGPDEEASEEESEEEAEDSDDE